MSELCISVMQVVSVIGAWQLLWKNCYEDACFQDAGGRVSTPLS